MSQTWKTVLELMERGNVQISEHGYDELSAEAILVRDVIDGARAAVVVEDYPNYPKGPCVLVLERDREDRPIHVVWGIPRGLSLPAVLVTAYRPDPERWMDGFRRRKR